MAVGIERPQTSHKIQSATAIVTITNTTTTTATTTTISSTV
jgi:hypothetical protein